VVRRKTSVVCIGVGSRLLTNVLAEAWVRLQRCSRLTSPMTRLLMGIWQHRRPIMSRGGLCQAAPAAPSTPLPGPYGRMACQPATAGGHSRFVDMIPHVSLSSWSSAARVLPTRVEGLSRNLMDGSTAGPQRERPLSSPDSSIVGTFDPIAFGPSVASPPPCNWRRPSLAVAGAGIAEARSVAANRLGSVK
jgi:hypothetical protein